MGLSEVNLQKTVFNLFIWNFYSGKGIKMCRGVIFYYQLYTKLKQGF